MIEGSLRKFDEIVLELVQDRSDDIEKDIWDEFWEEAVKCGIKIDVSTFSLGHHIDLRIKK